MTVRIMAGRLERHGKTRSQKIYDEIKAALDAGEDNLYLLVPEQYTLGAEGALMDYCQLPGLMGVDVLSLGRLADRIFEEVGGSVRRVIDDHGRQMLLAKTIKEVEESLTVYGKSAKKPGFLGNINDFISELKQNRMDGDALMATVEKMEDGRILRQKLRDIHTIYSTYETLLGEDRWDTDNRMLMLCEHILKSKKLKNAKIWIDGFYTFTASEFGILEALAGVAVDITMTLVGDLDQWAPDEAIFSICRATAQTMETIAGNTHQPFAIVTMPPEEDRGEALDHLARELFSYHPAPDNTVPDTVRLRQCQDIWDEGEKAAQVILSLTRDQGYAYSDIAILTGDPEVYGGPIARTLETYGIPSFSDRVVEMMDNHLVEALISALDAIDSRFMEDSLFAYGKSGFASLPWEDCCPLENYAMAMGIRGNLWRKPFTKGEDHWDLSALNAVREALMTPLFTFETALKEGETYGKKIRATVDFLEAIHVPLTIDTVASELEAQGDYEALGRYNQIWNSLMAVLDQVEGAMGDSPATLTEFLDILKGGFQTYSLGVLPERRDVVTITDSFRSRGRAPRALLILGANEGILPVGSNRFTLLSDAERSRLAGEDLVFQDQSQYRRAREEYALYLQIASVKDYLYLSFSMHNEDGETLGISPLVGNIRSVFPRLTVESALKEEADLEWIGGGLGTINQLGRRLSKKPGDGIDAQVYEYYQNQPQYQKIMRVLDRGIQYKGVEDHLPPELIPNLYGSPLKASVSRIEKYQACPFAHFMAYGVSPVPRKTYEVQAPDIGTLLHSVIDTVFTAARAQGTTINALNGETRDALVESALAKKMPEVGNAVFESTGSYRFLGRKMARVSRQTLRILSDHLDQGDFEFKYSEHFFEKALEAPKLPPGMTIRGVVDRIDTYVKDGDTFVKVIDYKTGNKKLDLAEVYYGLSLQLMVYMDAGLALLEEEGVRESLPGGTFYFHVDDPMVKGKLLDAQALKKKIDREFQMNGIFLDDPRVLAALDHDGGRASDIYQKQSDRSKVSRGEFEDLMAYVEGVILKSVENILGGDIGIRPYRMGTRTACDYCDYQSICQFDQQLSHGAYRVLKETMAKEELMKKLTGGKNHEVD